MTVNIEQSVFEAALKLSESERLILVAKLLDTLPENASGSCLDDEGLIDELDARSATPDGEVSWEDLREHF